MYELKPLSKAAIPTALEKANRYRLLEEPMEAESICRDVLRADPDNEQALVMLILSLTDQFQAGSGVNVTQVQELIPRLASPYERAYYGGIALERWAKSQFRDGTLGSIVYDWLGRAMAEYERAEPLRPSGNDDAILRWNACARFIDRHGQVQARPEEVMVDLEAAG